MSRDGAKRRVVHGLALGQPVTDRVLGKRRGERQPFLPAIMLAHPQEEDAQGVVPGVPRIGDIAVALHRTDKILN